VGPARTAAIPIALALASALAGCAGPSRAVRGDLPDAALAGRLAARAARWEGHAGPFSVGERRFPADCSGFVLAVYEAEGVPLRRLAGLAAPHETSGAAALHRAAVTYGVVFGGGGEWPAPGDLVFFHDTYDRNRDGELGDLWTHVALVEAVDGDQVWILHRGGKGIIRLKMNLAQPHDEATNDPVRSRNGRDPAGTRYLTGELFAGYGAVVE